jgi:hypothetical protein
VARRRQAMILKSTFSTPPLIVIETRPLTFENFCLSACAAPGNLWQCSSAPNVFLWERQVYRAALTHIFPSPPPQSLCLCKCMPSHADFMLRKNVCEQESSDIPQFVKRKNNMPTHPEVSNPVGAHYKHTAHVPLSPAPSLRPLPLALAPFSSPSLPSISRSLSPSSPPSHLLFFPRTRGKAR